jgi:hypothetical protein
VRVIGASAPRSPDESAAWTASSDAESRFSKRA